MAYAEAPPPPSLAPWVACLWRSRTTGGRVLPDGCVDIVWDGTELVVAGPATRPSDAVVEPGLDAFGVRFRVGAAGAGLGVAAAELRDRVVPVADLWGRRGTELAARVEEAGGVFPILAELGHRAGDGLPGPDPQVRAVLAGEPPHMSARQLRRRFTDAVGLRPAQLRSVLRLQRFLALAPTARAGELARLAAAAGYADQAHLARDARRLAGAPPSALLATGAFAAGERELVSPG
jgi:Helix-turn-helix domain